MKEWAMCILHADYHQMTIECWGAVFDWDQDHGALYSDNRDAYQLAVEQAMLKKVMK